MNKNYVPLTEVAEHSDTIRVLDLNLPDVPVESLELNVPRLERAMHWGGIKYLSIGSYEGEGTEYTATNFQFGMGGTISATGQKIAKKAEFAQRSTETTEGMGRYFKRRNTAVYFNSEAIREQSGQSTEGKVALMDKAMRAQLTKEIVDNEMGPGNLITEAKLAALVTACFFAGDVVLPGKPFTSGYSPVEIGSVLVLPKPTWPIVLKLLSALHDSRTNGTNSDKLKYSTMFTFRFDRALLASRHLMHKNLIRVSEVN